MLLLSFLRSSRTAFQRWSRRIKFEATYEGVIALKVRDYVESTISTKEGTTVFFRPMDWPKLQRKFDFYEVTLLTEIKQMGRGKTKKPYPSHPSLPFIDNRKNGIVVITLCYFDFMQSEAWIEHYRKQGVEQFIFYFNGQKIPEKLLELSKQEDIIVIQWPFHYRSVSMYHNNGRPFIAGKIAFTNHALEWLKTKSNLQYVLCIDIDEFIVGKAKLTDLIKSKKHEYSFSNTWSSNYKGFIRNETPCILSNSSLVPWKRVKSLTKISDVQTLDPHRILNENNMVQTHLMLHFKDMPKSGWVAPTRENSDPEEIFLEITDKSVDPTISHIWKEYSSQPHPIEE